VYTTIFAWKLENTNGPLTQVVLVDPRGKGNKRGEKGI